jgi:hypothetical protein
VLERILSHMPHLCCEVVDVLKPLNMLDVGVVGDSEFDPESKREVSRRSIVNGIGSKGTQPSF